MSVSTFFVRKKTLFLVRQSTPRHPHDPQHNACGAPFPRHFLRAASTHVWFCEVFFKRVLFIRQQTACNSMPSLALMACILGTFCSIGLGHLAAAFSRGMISSGVFFASFCLSNFAVWMIDIAAYSICPCHHLETVFVCVSSWLHTFLLKKVKKFILSGRSSSRLSVLLLVSETLLSIIFSQRRIHRTVVHERCTPFGA